MKLAAQPILQQPISNNRGNSRCNYYTHQLELGTYNVRSLGERGGLTLVWFNGPMGPVFLLHKEGKVVGYAELDSAVHVGMERRFYVSQLFIKTAYRGKKLATVLHLGALHVFGKLASDTSVAIGAVAAFHSLEKYGYKVRMLDTDTHKNVPFTWNEFGVPVVHGKPMTELETDFVLYV